MADEFTEEQIAALLADSFTAAELDGMDLPELQWQIRGVLPEGMTVLAGAPKAGKSFLAASIALAVASGGQLFGIAAQKRPVLYLALEDGKRRLQKRLRALYRFDEQHDLLGHNTLPATLTLLCTVEPLTLLATITAFLQAHPDDEPLIILDTFGKVKPPRPAGAEPYQADYQYASALKTIVDRVPGAALLVIHHTRKPKAVEALEDFVDALSGTNGIAGAADTILVLMRKRGSDEAELKVTGRDVTENGYALVAEKLTDAALHWRLDGEDLAAAAQAAGDRAAAAADAQHRRTGDRTSEVVAYVLRHPNVDLTPKSVAEGINASKSEGSPAMNNNDAGTYLRRLVSDGLVLNPGRGLYKYVSESVGMSESADNGTSEAENVSDTHHSDSDTLSESESPVSETESNPDQHEQPDSDIQTHSDTGLSPEHADGVATTPAHGQTDRVIAALAKARATIQQIGEATV